MRSEHPLSHDASKTIAFRVSTEDYDKIQMLADISGKQKQDYIRDRLLEDDMVVHPNIRVRKYLEEYLQALTEELRRLRKAEELSSGAEGRITALLKIIAQL